MSLTSFYFKIDTVWLINQKARLTAELSPYYEKEESFHNGGRFLSCYVWLMNSFLEQTHNQHAAVVRLWD